MHNIIVIRVLNMKIYEAFPLKQAQPFLGL